MSGFSKMTGVFLKYGPTGVKKKKEKDINHHRRRPWWQLDAFLSFFFLFFFLPLSSSWTRSVEGDGLLNVFPVDVSTLKAYRTPLDSEVTV